MTIHQLAGKPPTPDMLVNVPRLVTRYFCDRPDAGNPGERVAFGTSGHRGSALRSSFNEDHIAAVSQALADYRREQGIAGPLFVGIDTHALSEPALVTAVEVLAANGAELRLQPGGGYTPTPAVSRAILRHNEGRPSKRADGVVITPSHNPPEDGGFKYNPPSGGPADTTVTGVIEAAANRHLENGLAGVRRIGYRRALSLETTREQDFIQPYVDALDSAVDMEAIAASGLKIGADPLGGAAVGYWEPIAERWRVDIEVVNPEVDPTFRFMRVDRDGKIRMDCSSRYAMAGLIELRDRFDIAFGNDTDADRHGIVTPTGGLMNPNHYLAVCIDYLFRNRPGWRADAAIGKTLVSSSMIDRVARELGRPLLEVPVGFKWFVDGLLDGSCGFGGEESAGASFLRMDGGPWSTDKDGILLNLLAAEITARTGKNPAEHYRELEEKFGSPIYARIDAPATREQKQKLAGLSPEMVRAATLAGDPITARLTRAPGNGAPLGGIKVATEQGWFAARPSGTEEIYKIYAESFKGPEHLEMIQREAQQIVGAVI